jgi:pilus assembly protein CpaF
MLDFLSHCVRSRLNCLISGGTGAGKTTLLNVLSSFISERERIVTIEDAASCSCTRNTSRGLKRGRPTWKAKAPSGNDSW